MADRNPFIVHRRSLDVYERAIDSGLDDDGYCSLVTEADDRVAEVDGRGFRETPVITIDGAPPAAAPVVAKIETGNVGDSHKARHLFGLLLTTLIDQRSGRRAADGSAGRSAEEPALAIASCGNAALGAAVVAKAATRRLRVFVPTDADTTIVDRLLALGADVEPCPRQPGETGDPCVARLHDAIGDGAEPFTVQGPVCPDVIDGGRTLGLELASQLDELGLDPQAIYIQIGGGALATATMDGLARAWPDRPLPRLHPVQAASAHPYVAAWHRLVDRVLASLTIDDPGTEAGRAAILSGRADHPQLDEALDADDLMTPWPGTPTSVATGILDDITYDWRTVLEHQLSTAGYPILVDEATFADAKALAASQSSPSPRPDETGAAGLAGLLAHAATDPAAIVGPSVVLLTG